MMDYGRVRDRHRRNNLNSFFKIGDYVFTCEEYHKYHSGSHHGTIIELEDRTANDSNPLARIRLHNGETKYLDVSHLSRDYTVTNKSPFKVGVYVCTNNYYKVKLEDCFDGHLEGKIIKVKKRRKKTPLVMIETKLGERTLIDVEELMVGRIPIPPHSDKRSIRSYKKEIKSLKRQIEYLEERIHLRGD